jgi:hypothetical protein
MSEIAPDTKDWTWVLERPCPECGLDTTTIAPSSVARLLRENADSWDEVLRNGPDVRARSRPDRWSPLEYGCHVRDVLILGNERIARMLNEDDPALDNWDQDATAIEKDYGSSDPTIVADQLVAAARLLSDRLDGVTGSDWDRMATRSDGARFSVATFARYEIHDPVHHLMDVR